VDSVSGRHDSLVFEWSENPNWEGDHRWIDYDDPVVTRYEEAIKAIRKVLLDAIDSLA
jgi:hypothetical protein